MNTLILGNDGLYRPAWADEDEVLREYFDFEWGAEIRTEQGLFERLCLESFQSGLSWKTVLNKRPALREAFANFDPTELAGWDENDVERLLNNPKIIRNRRKITSVLTNAQKTVALRESTPLPELLWSFAPGDHVQPTGDAEIPSVTDESKAMAKELKKLGFMMVGPTTCYALMQAAGLVNDRPVECAPVRERE